MSKEPEPGGFINSKADAANVHITRDMQDVARAQYLGHDNPAFIESERIADAYDRREREARRQQFREDILRANRWAAFQTAISRLQLTPEQIRAAVERIFLDAKAKAEIEAAESSSDERTDAEVATT
jgi:hypothetical protein